MNRANNWRNNNISKNTKGFMIYIYIDRWTYTFIFRLELINRDDREIIIIARVAN